MINTWLKIYYFLMLIKRLHILLESGLSLKESCEQMSVDIRPTACKKSAQKMKESLDKQGNFTQAIQSIFPQQLPLALSKTSTIAEHQAFLSELIDYLESRLQSIKSVAQSLMYPLFLFHLCIAILYVFHVFVKPQFLPALTTSTTQNTLSLYQQLTQSHIVIPIFIVLYVSLTSAGLFYLHKRLLSPKTIADTCWLLSLLLKQGLSLKESVHALPRHHQSLAKFAEELHKHGDLREATHKSKLIALPFLEALFLSHVDKNLSYAFNLVSTRLHEKNKRQINRLMSIIQPLCLFFIAVLIMYLVIFLFQPLINQINNVIL